MDNYTEFIQRLDAASAKLQRRRESVGTALDVLTWLHTRHFTGLQQWEQRTERVARRLDTRMGTPPAYKSLSDLEDIARNMESMFRKRTERIDERLAVVQQRCDEIDRSLRELERSRMKLESSRMLRFDRENLRKAMTDLAGTADASISEAQDPSLRDELGYAREAIALAEALLELKED